MIDKMLLETAAKEAGMAIINSLPNQEGCERQFSIGFETKMNALLLHHKSKHNKQIIRAIAAIVLIALIGGCFVMVLNPSVRADVMGWVRKLTDNNASYTYSDKDSMSVIEKYRPSYIPNGWKEEVLWEDENGGSIIYDNGTDEVNSFDYVNSSSSVGYSFNNNEVLKEVYINNIRADLYISENKNGQLTLVWEKNDILFSISAYLTEEEIIKMAESVGVIK